MSTIWDGVGERFEEFLRHLSHDLRAADKGFRVATDRYANDSFPLRAGVSYSPLTSPGDEQLVISLDVKRSGDVVEAIVDIARGDGFILAEQEILRANESRAQPEELGEQARAAERKAEEFLRSQTTLLSLELDRARKR